MWLGRGGSGEERRAAECLERGDGRTGVQSEESDWFLKEGWTFLFAVDVDERVLSLIRFIGCVVHSMVEG